MPLTMDANGGRLLMSLIALAAVAFDYTTVARAKDPAEGWLSYATASCPAGTRLTRFEGKWRVPSMAAPSDAFYSPWIGSDTTDNMNLIQPVNPWMGSSWSFYSEYFQWEPMSNRNSESVNCDEGDRMWGVIQYDNDNAYTIMQHDLTSGKRSGMKVPVQSSSATGEPKNYTIVYVVFEKVQMCATYPPDEYIMFHDLIVECDWKRIEPDWKTSYVDDVCDFRAHVINPKIITMTWNTSAPSHPSLAA